jgi:hypothetical protein
MSQKNIKRKAETQKPNKKQKTFGRRPGSSAAGDIVNRKLLGLLRENARETYAEIGRRAQSFRSGRLRTYSTDGT